MMTDDKPKAESSISDFHTILRVKPTDEEDVFESQSHKENFLYRLYGGQVLAQALNAAYKTVENWEVHSLHAYFLRSGQSNIPVIYAVERVRDGGSFGNRSVVARQAGKEIFRLMASFHKKEDGFEHQDYLEGDIIMPEELLDSASPLEKTPEYSARDTAMQPFQIIPFPDNVYTSVDRHKPDAYFWIRTLKPLTKDKSIQTGALAFASDLGLLATALLPHPTSLFRQEIMPASIDHAMWFHNHDFSLCNWLLCHTHSPWAGNARGFARASIYTRDKKLIASTAQEGLIRYLGQ